MANTGHTLVTGGAQIAVVASLVVDGIGIAAEPRRRHAVARFVALVGRQRTILARGADAEASLAHGRERAQVGGHAGRPIRGGIVSAQMGIGVAGIARAGILVVARGRTIR